MNSLNWFCPLLHGDYKVFPWSKIYFTVNSTIFLVTKEGTNRKGINCCSVTKLCLILCDPMNHITSPPTASCKFIFIALMYPAIRGLLMIMLCGVLLFESSEDCRSWCHLITSLGRVWSSQFGFNILKLDANAAAHHFLSGMVLSFCYLWRTLLHRSSKVWKGKEDTSSKT